MKVFKLYLKIVKKNFVTIAIYIIVFLALAMLFAANQNNSPSQFSKQQLRAVIINNDSNSPLINGLITYLDQYLDYRDIKEDDLHDALYFREIYVVLRIPHNFTEDWLNEVNPTISKEIIPDAQYLIINAENAINQYLNLAKMYHTNMPTLSLEELVLQLNNDLTKEASVNPLTQSSLTTDNSVFYFNYLSYVLFAVIFSIVGLISLRLNKLDIKRRMQISPYKQTKVNLELFLGHSVITFGLVFLTCMLSILFYQKAVLNFRGVLFFINALSLASSILAISYTISLVIKTTNALPAIANVMSLGTSFLSGVFVPQFIMGKEVLAFAHIFPNYYFVANNHKIANLISFNWQDSKSIFSYIGIQLLFTLFFIVLSIIIAKNKNKDEV